MNGRVTKDPRELRVGVVSDTHGLLRPEVLRRLDGVDHILHAGDIGRADILVELAAVAPVTAVFGNTDDFEVRADVPEEARLELAGRQIIVVHGHQLGSPTPDGLRIRYPRADIVVYGHTHRPLLDQDGSPLVLNPGSVGARRFDLPVSLAFLRLGGRRIEVELVEL